VITGLLYVQTGGHDMHHSLRTVERPLRGLEFDELCHGADKLDRLQAQYR
jgi:hypothetical protein